MPVQEEDWQLTSGNTLTALTCPSAPDSRSISSGQLKKVPTGEKRCAKSTATYILI